MKLIIKFTVVIFMSFTFHHVNALSTGIIVVANTEYTNISVGKRQVRDIFMQSNSQLGLRPVTLTPNNQARFVFNTKVVGLTESRIQSYWAQMRFGGKKRPPQEFETVEAMLNYVKNNKNTVTYLPADIEVPQGLTVIYQID